MRLVSVTVVLLLASLLVCAPAQPTPVLPSSALLFPYYDSDLAAGTATLVSVTNTNASRLVGPNTFKKGDVVVHYYYVDGKTCQITNRRQFLTPNDILTVLGSEHNPTITQGYLIVFAEDPETGRAIQFNHLVGDAVFFDFKANKMWSFPAIGFRGRIDEKTATERSRTGHAFTDAIANGGNGNGRIDFDGREYDRYPDELIISSFIEERCTVRGRICLISPLGGDFKVELLFLIYDNEEDVFSRLFTFKCWTCVDLGEISKVVANLGGSTQEIFSGWIRIDGVKAINVLTGKYWRNEVPAGTDLDPPVIGAFTERVINVGHYTGRLMHWQGAQNGNEFPPDSQN